MDPSAQFQCLAKSAKSGRVGCRTRGTPKKVAEFDIRWSMVNSKSQEPPPNSAKGLSSGDSASRSRDICFRQVISNSSVQGRFCRRAIAELHCA